MKRMSQAADGTPILGASIGTLTRRFRPFCMIKSIAVAEISNNTSPYY
jgi:hypothetical protein